MGLVLSLGLKRRLRATRKFFGHCPTHWAPPLPYMECFQNVLTQIQQILVLSCSLNTVSISEDSSLLSGGFEDSSVRVWSLTPKKLRMLKPPSELAQIDKEAGLFNV